MSIESFVTCIGSLASILSLGYMIGYYHGKNQNDRWS